MQGGIPFFSNNIWGTSKVDLPSISSPQGGSGGNSNNRSRPGTSSGDQPKEHSRKPSFNRKSSFSSPSKVRRRASSSTLNGVVVGGGGGQVITDATAPPALPDYALATAAKLSRDKDKDRDRDRDRDKNKDKDKDKKNFDLLLSPTSLDSFSTMAGRSMSISTTHSTGLIQSMTGAPSGASGPHPSSLPSTSVLSSEMSSLHVHIQEIANKRISTLDYLRKSQEGRLYWFNTLLFDRPDLARMPFFDSRKLGRRATNYFLLGLSIPVVIDLNSGTSLEFLRSLNTLLAEFESYQQIHTENGVSSSSLSRARLPQMFRRPGGKGRRQSSATGADYTDPNGNSFNKDGSAVNAAPATVINFGLGGEGNELLPGEEYTHLLTPNLPFDPDFFETFATLCDVLIDCYTRLLGLLTGPKDCTPIVVELFTKADQKVRKLLMQSVVKEFEDSSRTGLKQEMNNIGKFVIGGLM
ncbi:hypothetical protein GGS21DRAFT_212436 [Xylaria nigripes]|nr:hypothetical protein GGS21DRAFT_212436 [Xylaria nigripes]